MKLNKIYFITIVSSISLFSCNNEKNDEFNKPLFEQPISIKANFDPGYTTNQFTGDTILPIINKNGDTVVTGQPLEIKGKIICMDSMPKPIEKPAPNRDKLIPIKAQSNVSEIPNDLKFIPLNHDLLKTVKINAIMKNGKDHFFLNSNKDTIPTGIPLKITGKIIKAKHPEFTSALLPRFREKAIYDMQYMNTDQGMISANVEAILEDKSGNFWFGTSAGVSKFDGKNFAHYTAKEGFSDEMVRSIIMDKQGDLWFCTWGDGVIKYDGVYFTHFTTEQGMSDNQLFSVTEDKNGNLWFATFQNGISKYDGHSITHLRKGEGLISNNVRSIVEDNDGNIWIGTQRGLTKYDGKSFAHITKKEGLNDNNIFQMTKDGHGNIWIGTKKGLNKYDGSGFVDYSSIDVLASVIWTLEADQKGNVWVGNGHGAFKVEDDLLTSYSSIEGIKGDGIQSILVSKSGLIWFATYTGITIFNPKSTQFFPNQLSISCDILKDRSGLIWLAQEDSSVLIYDGQEFIEFGQIEGGKPSEILVEMGFDSKYSVNAMLEDRKGDFWFGTDGGAVKYNGTTFTSYGEREGFLGSRVFSILEDREGSIWFGTIEGLIKLNGNTFTNYTRKHGFVGEWVTSLSEDTHGDIWLNTSSNGLLKYDGKHFTYYSEKEGLSGNNLSSINADDNGNIWFKSWKDGVIKFDGNTFTRFTQNNGLCSDEIVDITCGLNGEVWVSTQKGLNFIAISNKKLIQGEKVKTDQELSYSVKQLVKHDGLQDAMFYSVDLINDKCDLFLTGTKGVAIISDAKNVFSKKAPEISVIQLKINEEFFSNLDENKLTNMQFEQQQGILFENCPLQLELPHDQNHLTFHFTGIDWSAPHRIQYSFLLKGLNNNWSETSTETKVDFRELPYGNYTFKVKAIGQSQKWSEPFEYDFTILPPWWHTWWARVGYGLVAFSLFFGYIKWREVALKKRQKELETKVIIATKEITEQRNRSDELLLNILPAEVAEELKNKGESEARDFEDVSVLFTDFIGFTSTAEKLTAKELVYELNDCFKAFDDIITHNKLEKIKTIGDAYMAAGGLNKPQISRPNDVVVAALEMQKFMNTRKKEHDEKGLPFFEMRVGIHTGPVVAGIVGVKKFQYDIWGDTVNTAARMESTGKVGKVNISKATYELLKSDPQFAFESRGRIEAKGKGEIEMWFVSRA